MVSVLAIELSTILAPELVLHGRCPELNYIVRSHLSQRSGRAPVSLALYRFWHLLSTNTLIKRT